MKLYICLIFLICILYFIIVDVLVPLNNNLIKESYLLLGVLPLKVYKDLTKPEKLKIELHSIE
jgi:hypothetical protein